MFLAFGSLLEVGFGNHFNFSKFQALECQNEVVLFPSLSISLKSWALYSQGY